MAIDWDLTCTLVLQRPTMRTEHIKYCCKKSEAVTSIPLQSALLEISEKHQKRVIWWEQKEACCNQNIWTSWRRRQNCICFQYSCKPCILLKLKRLQWVEEMGHYLRILALLAGTSETSSFDQLLWGKVWGGLLYYLSRSLRYSPFSLQVGIVNRNKITTVRFVNYDKRSDNK